MSGDALSPVSLSGSGHSFTIFSICEVFCFCFLTACLSALEARLSHRAVSSKCSSHNAVVVLGSAEQRNGHRASRNVWDCFYGVTVLVCFPTSRAWPSAPNKLRGVLESFCFVFFLSLSPPPPPPFLLLLPPPTHTPAPLEPQTIASVS